MPIIVCPICGRSVEKKTGEVNRAIGAGRRLFCGSECSGVARRIMFNTDERKAKKAEYDRKYRALNADRKKEQSRIWYQKTKDPEKEREYRKLHMARHIEYCRNPGYRKRKSEYDRRYRAVKEYGEFAESFLALLDVEKEIGERMDRFEVYAINGRKGAQWRKRQLSSQLQT